MSFIISWRVTDWAKGVLNVFVTGIYMRTQSCEEMYASCRGRKDKNCSEPEIRGLEVFLCVLPCITASMMGTAESEATEIVAVDAQANDEGIPAKDS
ncbi:hypothetical protein CHS0354_032457 [Potamilus streckersoni]|uniref:Uncharacterized protein n=1 Tax=Potamilus streckersoni TaxID=2493646 RepID=A0AAE0SQG4_9BIVA|nr:hypothetical protein CHS0354_032457 [Potamilus streckersoni]